MKASRPATRLTIPSYEFITSRERHEIDHGMQTEQTFKIAVSANDVAGEASLSLLGRAKSMDNSTDALRFLVRELRYDQNQYVDRFDTKKARQGFSTTALPASQILLSVRSLKKVIG